MTDNPFRLGWEEWLALPDLGLPALKAKIDTGARTSALHAFDIEPFGPATAPKVRFAVHPIPGRDDVTVACAARVADRREVISSNGEGELRFVIHAEAQMGERRWPIEVSLTDRSSMAYRMLLGRLALGDDMVVSPNDAFCQPELTYDVYSTRRLRAHTRARPLRVAVLSREASNYSTSRLVQAGEKRGHTVEVIDTLRCYMAIDALAPEVHIDGRRLPRFDAVIPRVGASVTAYGTAVIRQLETVGTYCINGSDGIVASRDKLHAHQVLARARIAMPRTAFAASPKDTDNLIGLVGQAPIIVKLLESSQGKGVVLAETQKAAQSVISAFRGLRANFLVQEFVEEAGGEDVRCLVVAGKVVAAMKRRAAEGEFRSNLHQGGSAETVKLTKTERETATKAARAFGLGFAGVDLLRSKDGPKVLEVNSSPGIEGIEKATDRDVAGLVFDEIERQVRRTPARRAS